MWIATNVPFGIGDRVYITAGHHAGRKGTVVDTPPTSGSVVAGRYLVSVDNHMDWWTHPSQLELLHVDTM